jgi:hypothetical protein
MRTEARVAMMIRKDLPMHQNRRARARVAVRNADTAAYRLWLIAALTLVFAAVCAMPAMAAPAAPEQPVERLIAYAATASAGSAAQPFGAPAVQADPAPRPRALAPERLVVAGSIGLGFATILALLVSMLDGAVRDLGFRGARRRSASNPV